MVTYDPSYKSAPITQYGNPTTFASFKPATGSVMQDFIFSSNQRFFITQAGNGSNGTTSPYNSTVITRLNPDTGNSDFMRLTDGGHGLGFEVEYGDGKTWIWMTWHGKSSASGNRENDFVRFPYVPGTFTRAQVVAAGDFIVLPVQDGPEAVYHFDWVKGWAVERHFEFDGSGETYKRRKIADIKNGVDTVYNSFKIATNPPTVQGFCTVNDTIFRWVGKGFSNNTPVSGDGVRVEQYDWNTGQLVGSKDFPTLGQNGPGTWRDGVCEPEGCSIYRETDGTASMLVGITTGASGNHAWHTYQFKSIGAA